MPSTETASAPVTPAWKRLGLKLKQPGAAAGAPAPAPAPASRGPNRNPAVGQPGGSTGHKRKGEAPPTTGGSPVKKTRREEASIARNASSSSSSSSKPKKTVKFGDTPSKNDGRSPPPTPAPKKPKKPKDPSSKKQQEGRPRTADIKPALEYLRQWKTSRESWKFNKNYQTLLIRDLFEPERIPATDIETFYEYVRDLKGYVRERLRETAMEVQMQDVADGPAGFPEDTMDIDERQGTYDAILADILRRKRQQSSPKRKYFTEAQYVAESQDGDVIIRRVVKRMRAERVLDEMSDSGGETEATTTTTTSSSSRTVTASDNNATTTTNGDKQPAKVNEAPGSNRRRRKLRVNMDDSSSSESESDSDDETSSSSSSSEDDSESEEEVEGRANEGYDTSSSSSSSSSSSDEGSEEEEDSDDED